VNQVEFASATHGYATSVRSQPVGTDDHPRYTTALFATVDGGRTWRALIDPRGQTSDPHMWVIDPRTIVLLADADATYESTDGGATFRFHPGLNPPAMDAILCRSGCAHSRYDGSSTLPLTTPEIPGYAPATTHVGGGLFWSVSKQDGSFFTAVSTDGGAIWRRHGVPEHPGGRPDLITLSSSAGGHDPWLVGYMIDGGVGANGRSAPMRRKEVGVPLLWLFEGGQWVPKGTVSAPTSKHHAYEVAAIGGGLAAVTGPHGIALVDTAWHYIEMSPLPQAVTTMCDGTIVASAHTKNTVYLGTRAGSGVRWTQVAIEVAQ